MINRLLLFGLFIILVLETTRLVPLALLPGLSVKNLVLYVMVIALGVRAALSPTGLKFTDLDIHLTFLALILYAFLTWAIWSAFEPTYSSWRSFVVLKSQVVDYYLLFFVFRYAVQTLEDSLWVLRACVATVLLANAVVLVDYLFRLGLFGIHHGRAEGFINEANQYGALLAFFLPIAIGTVLSAFRRARRLWWPLIAVTAFVLIATGSRGAYLGTVVGPFIAAWYLRRYVDFLTVLKSGGVALMLVASLTVIAVVAVDLEFIVTRVAGLFSDDLGRASAGRTDIWAAAIRVMLEWPLSFVVGYGWFSYASSGIWKAAHSEYIRTFYELGVIGLTALVALFFVLISRTRERLAALPPGLRRLQIAYVFGLVAMLIAVIFVDIPSTWPLVWAFTGLMIGIQAYGQQPAEEPAEETPVSPQPSANMLGGKTGPSGGGGPAWVSNTKPS